MPAIVRFIIPFGLARRHEARVDRHLRLRVRVDKARDRVPMRGRRRRVGHDHAVGGRLPPIVRPAREEGARVDERADGARAAGIGRRRRRRLRQHHILPAFGLAARRTANLSAGDVRLDLQPERATPQQ